MSYQFMGFRRPDGRVGARNLVGVIPSVTCANDVAQAIVTEVQGTVGYFHHQGCCQLPPDLDRVTATLTSLGQSPNLGAVLIVSLGCEGTDFEQMYKTIEASGKPVRIIGIQELGGVSNAIQKGIDLARELVMEISGQQRQPAARQGRDQLSLFHAPASRQDPRPFYRQQDRQAQRPFSALHRCFLRFSVFRYPGRSLSSGRGRHRTPPLSVCSPALAAKGVR